MRVDRLHQGHDHREELGILMRVVARRQPVLAVRTSHGPVIVLTGTIHTGVGLLMQEADEVVLFGDVLQRLHHDHVVVDGQV